MGCNHAVVGVLIIHRGRVATAMRQKPPLNRAPSAGHVDREDGLSFPIMNVGDPNDAPFLASVQDMREGPARAFYRAAVREAGEETSLPIDKDRLQLLLTYQAADDCAKTAHDGGPGGMHLWQVFGYEVPTMSEPTLLDEPGKMHGWDFRSVRNLLADPDLEPIWRDLLMQALKTPEGKALLWA
jgi:8-oxo-dGTP pyrophosphatase MutT (NUDIX family)